MSLCTGRDTYCYEIVLESGREPLRKSHTSQGEAQTVELAICQKPRARDTDQVAMIFAIDNSGTGFDERPGQVERRDILQTFDEIVPEDL
jgi:hypothetical protein